MCNTISFCKRVKAKWVKTVKKSETGERFACARLVAMEINHHKDMDNFVGTPPLEALRALVSEAATVDDKEEKVIDIDDVSRAFFEAPAVRQVCVELPDEDLNSADKAADNVGHLQMSLYGTRDAAMKWQEEVAREMKKRGFKRRWYNRASTGESQMTSS